jgi:hypothetical protein
MAVMQVIEGIFWIYPASLQAEHLYAASSTCGNPLFDNIQVWIAVIVDGWGSHRRIGRWEVLNLLFGVTSRFL